MWHPTHQTDDRLATPVSLKGEDGPQRGHSGGYPLFKFNSLAALPGANPGNSQPSTFLGNAPVPPARHLQAFSEALFSQTAHGVLGRSEDLREQPLALWVILVYGPDLPTSGIYRNTTGSKKKDY